MSLLVTSITMGKNPDRLLHKGADYLRTRTNRGMFANHRQSAVELLAASKAKFYHKDKEVKDNDPREVTGQVKVTGDDEVSLDTKQDLVGMEEDDMRLHGKSELTQIPRSKSDVGFCLSQAEINNKNNNKNNNNNNTSESNNNNSVDKVPSEELPVASRARQVAECPPVSVSIAQPTTRSSRVPSPGAEKPSLAVRPTPRARSKSRDRPVIPRKPRSLTCHATELLSQQAIDQHDSGIPDQTNSSAAPTTSLNSKPHPLVDYNANSPGNTLASCQAVSTPDKNCDINKGLNSNAKVSPPVPLPRKVKPTPPPKKATLIRLSGLSDKDVKCSNVPSLDKQPPGLLELDASKLNIQSFEKAFQQLLEFSPRNNSGHNVTTPVNNEDSVVKQEKPSSSEKDKQSSSLKSVLLTEKVQSSGVSETKSDDQSPPTIPAKTYVKKRRSTVESLAQHFTTLTSDATPPSIPPKINYNSKLEVKLKDCSNQSEASLPQHFTPTFNSHPTPPTFQRVNPFKVETRLSESSNQSVEEECSRTECEGTFTATPIFISSPRARTLPTPYHAKRISYNRLESISSTCSSSQLSDRPDNPLTGSSSQLSDRPDNPLRRKHSSEKQPASTYSKRERRSKHFLPETPDLLSPTSSTSNPTQYLLKQISIESGSNPTLYRRHSDKQIATEPASKPTRPYFRDSTQQTIRAEMSMSESVQHVLLPSEPSALPSPVVTLHTMESSRDPDHASSPREVRRTNSSLSGKLEPQDPMAYPVLQPDSPSFHLRYRTPPSVPRSHSDISCRLESQHSRDSSLVSSHSRLSRASAGADLENFFNQMGLEAGIIDPTRLRQLQEGEVFDSVSSLNSEDAASICSAYSRSEKGDWGESPQVGKSPGASTSVIERNARIIKWLCNVKKAAKPISKEESEAVGGKL